MSNCFFTRQAISVGLILLLATAAAFAQSDSLSTSRPDSIPKPARFSVGLGMAIGATIATDAPEHWKLSPLAAYHGDIDLRYRVSKLFAGTLTIGMETRGSKYYWFSNKEIWEKRQVNYITLTPGIQLGAFHASLNLGFPNGGVKSWQNSVGEAEHQTEFDNDSDSLSVMVEPRIGVIIPLVDEEIGWLGLTMSLGYNISDMSAMQAFLPGQINKSIGSQTASVYLGFTWQFNIPGVGRMTRR